LNLQVGTNSPLGYSTALLPKLNKYDKARPEKRIGRRKSGYFRRDYDNTGEAGCAWNLYHVIVRGIEKRSIVDDVREKETGCLPISHEERSWTDYSAG
jgi:hypothetical protein